MFPNFNIQPQPGSTCVRKIGILQRKNDPTRQKKQILAGADPRTTAFTAKSHIQLYLTTPYWTAASQICLQPLVCVGGLAIAPWDHPDEKQDHELNTTIHPCGSCVVTRGCLHPGRMGSRHALGFNQGQWLSIDPAPATVPRFPLESCGSASAEFRQQSTGRAWVGFSFRCTSTICI
jgi:hypothetical protein